MNQNLRKEYPAEKLFLFLEKYTPVKMGSFFIFNIDIFKKIKYLGGIGEICEELKDYYYPSKQTYLMREQKYSRFTTVLRHLCNSSNTPFTTQICYANNTYYITYYIKDTRF
jgi:hypothetical protein